jgi:4-carboxymuconolactone decarboxylase
MAETPTFGRYAEIPYEKMTPEQQEGYRAMIEARGRLPGPNKIYVHNPRLSKVIGPFGAHFRKGYSLSEREREIAVCIINSKWHSGYPTSSHERSAKAAGLPADKVEAILSGLPASFEDKRERSSTKWRSVSPIHAGYRRGSMSVRWKPSAMSASPM